ncbi:hypothetical protein DSM3645_06539 [Blastopirellula marina DSM 3645]|uniref:Uncharacterized protein n=1 Tax=Blastopirellula marina DSM 3645 TaxID=314230 RepID=A4A137_9BACT|nr:hypothetical protein DSM3645_06539 [Blastopirellula marina DSM 3645]
MQGTTVSTAYLGERDAGGIEFVAVISSDAYLVLKIDTALWVVTNLGRVPHCRWEVDLVSGHVTKIGQSIKMSQPASFGQSRL